MSRGRKERTAGREPGPRDTRRRVIRAAERALWIAVVLLFAWRVSPQVRAAVGWGSGGTDAPSVAFAMLDGRRMPLEELRGRVVLVNFWATWCPPCRAEMPGFQRVYESRRDSGFTVLGVSTDQLSGRHVAAWLLDRGIDYPVAMATSEVVAAFGGVNSYPTSFLMDRRGRIRYTVRGIFAEPTLRAAVDRLLAEDR